jgi:hypothetical protein
MVRVSAAAAGKAGTARRRAIACGRQRSDRMTLTSMEAA